MKRIALKIDVDTYQGTLTGVPALAALLQQNDASGTFFFSLGPDGSGRDTRAGSLCTYYGLKTRLYGRLLPAPEIAKHCADTLHEVGNQGFEVGIHAWNRVAWEQKSRLAANPWIEFEMGKACVRFSEIFGERAQAHAAAGWHMNRHALRQTQRLGFSYASDCRGCHPFIPVIDGEIIACPQLPTTLPTLDEIMSLEPNYIPEQAADRILQLSSAIAGDHVFTLRAELEGMKFQPAIERMIAGWKAQGYQLVALRELRATLELGDLPRHGVMFSAAPGRPGVRMTQGPAFLHD